MTMIAVQVVDVLAVPHARVPARVAVLLIVTGSGWCPVAAVIGAPFVERDRAFRASARCLSRSAHRYSPDGGCGVAAASGRIRNRGEAGFATPSLPGASTGMHAVVAPG
jgi:hypothetical protein